jgi:hypothetical protein
VAKHDDTRREVLPIPDRKPVGLTTYDAKDPNTSSHPSGRSARRPARRTSSSFCSTTSALVRDGVRRHRTLPEEQPECVQHQQSHRGEGGLQNGTQPPPRLPKSSLFLDLRVVPRRLSQPRL